MRTITQGDRVTTALIMVDQTMRSVTDTPPTIKVRPGGGIFRPAAGDLTPIYNDDGTGSGWWEYKFTAHEVATIGNLIIEARIGDNPIWRDVFFVAPRAGVHQASAAAAIQRAGVHQAAGAAAIQRAGADQAAGTALIEGTSNLIVNGDFLGGLNGWRVYCPSGVDVNSRSDGLSVRRILATNNCQIFQTFSILPGNYEIKFEARSVGEPVTIGLRLIEHRAQYRNLGLNESIAITPDNTIYQSKIIVPKRMIDPARIMIWLETLQPGEEILIRSISLSPAS